MVAICEQHTHASACCHKLTPRVLTHILTQTLPPPLPSIHNQVVANCEQLLTSRYSRRLIIMQKVAAYDAAAAEAHFEARGPPK